MAFIKDKFKVEAYLTQNRLGIWYYALINDEGKEFWKCVKIVQKDRKTKKVIKTQVVNSTVVIPQNVRDRAKKVIDEKEKNKQQGT